ncbi:tRNA (5-methylaminomethyl-2-thiouridylate)-methyltransferase [Candidatus Kryptonium thompsonii]|uniref:tRNA-specific 2-thiouridylase MnmA n=1 Tax=Candidatus Kryptonium thompsonii TaxID=1633631 RepID=A0A0P1P9R8_9BACT|nr:tRNA 2-thiouridine(34) synthase MnmA [Candidatus Kryptonium thompsoni]CUS78023.1 tRNA (5-methylaminomethyl-2-thiouridylate)-methyltransferase [Candidatus Kryptonium thompsoni]CUS79281.1 tRNA (5-methylaminomethyl-2-thiouridylate)-methyltransferase [Candidatus Kryptonium thompsoni]CUS80896.1 tRNA (5-methylaminomethyl-2-thiouridylate)-methyltransferase [Candidatus Kryptonium thompsoni]CUS84230.1 tRNA (5-methylaminomethyl-2-thiouridylate)-methyltransferase [Candidatus Kryptonium thompsoni]CUS86
MRNSKEKTVVVAMSGGVDSSVAAGILKEQGYNLIGITIKTYNYEDIGVQNEHSCCSLEGINDARIVAAKLGFPHYVIDFTKEFYREVINYFIKEYLEGKTPNPCVICNRKIKWEALIRKALSLGADYIATGHYARIRFDEKSGRYILMRGVDASKDQSYALWGLTQESLSRTIFPLGELTKQEVRELAKKYGLKTANKPESFEICFVPENDYTKFLEENVEGLAEKVKGGDIVMNGKVIGKHRGYPFYTIGQRKGLGVALGYPVYVIGIDPERNIIEVGSEEKLYHNALIAGNVNLISVDKIEDGMRVTAKIRYSDEGSPAILENYEGGKILVKFEKPKRAITPGQSVVFYDGDVVVGGGIIESVLDV